MDCVAEAARALPTQRTALGGVIRPGRPVVTLTLIGLCVASFILQLVVPGWTERWAFSPYAGFHEPWRFLTAAFLHSQTLYLHIVFNMVALWFVGPMLEQVLGRIRFLTLYLLSAVGGSVGLVLLTANPHLLVADPELILRSSLAQASLGASGAVFGLFGAALVVTHRLGGDYRGIIGLIVVNFVIGFIAPGIAWQAHLGGLVTGGLLAAAYAYAPKERRTLVALVAPTVLVIALFVVATLKYQSFGIFF